MVARIANQNDGMKLKYDKAVPIPSILILEEPEANLHPAFQAKLAELFIDAGTKFNIQFIIETHSEYLIRKIQALTVKKELASRDSIIYYFNDPDPLKRPKDEPQIKKIRILDNGSLSDEFGKGFIDVTDNLALELKTIKKGQKN